MSVPTGCKRCGDASGRRVMLQVTQAAKGFAVGDLLCEQCARELGGRIEPRHPAAVFHVEGD